MSLWSLKLGRGGRPSKEPSGDTPSEKARRLLGWAPHVKTQASDQGQIGAPRTRSKLSARFGVQHGARSSESALKLQAIATSPTLAIAWIGLGLIGVLYNASRFQINMAYAVSFLGATSMLASAWIGFLNLRGLRLCAHPTAAPVTAGEMARFSVVVEDCANKRRKQLVVTAGEQVFELAIEPGGRVEIAFCAPATHAGRLLAPIIKISTPYPLGIWNIHHLWAPRQEALVWPAPELNAPSLKGIDDAMADGQPEKERPKDGADGFHALRPYRRGDGLRRVAWRVYARTDGRVLATRLGEDTAAGQDDLWIDEQATRDLPSIQRRIARLAAWVMQAHATGRPYGLKAFGQELNPGCGQDHLNQCMSMLALGPDHKVEVAYGLREWA